MLVKVTCEELNATVELNEVFVPGLEASQIIYECPDCKNKTYHVMDDMVSMEDALRLVRNAAVCNYVPAYNKKVTV